MTRTFPASSITAVEANTVGGNITVNGNAGTDAIVEVYFTSNNDWSEEKIKKTIEECYTFDIHVKGGKLYAVAKTKSENIETGSVSFIITVPAKVKSDLQSVSGNICVSNLSGSHNFKTVGGSLIVENVLGKIKGNTVGGNINVTNTKGNNIVLNTVSGNITAKDCSNVYLTTVDGDITTKGVFQKLKASSVNGHIY
jgi:DUF4097 and DUF4098 domain-containing protein YvlB